MPIRRTLFVAGALSLTACSGTLRRPIETTEAATRLEQVTRSDTNELDPAIAPDATALAYEVSAAPGAPSRLDVMSLKGGNGDAPGRVVYGSGAETGREPAWMPDGSAVVFVSRTVPEKTLMEMIGHGARQPPFVAMAGGPSLSGEWPAISPDGARVAMSVGDVEAFQTGWPTTRDFDHELGLSDLHGNVSLVGQGTEPSWSPDGERLAFVRRSDGHAHLFVANADGSEAHAITDGSSDDVQPTWSPDGKRIAFCAIDTVGRSAQANIFTAAPDGSGMVQLTEGDRFSCRPSWGTDGFIYFHANATDRFHIWRMRPRVAD